MALEDRQTPLATLPRVVARLGLDCILCDLAFSKPFGQQMRRRSSGKFYDKSWKLYNVRKDVDPKRLQSIGALILEWNYIEGGINMIVGLSLKLPALLWIPVSSRIN